MKCNKKAQLWIFTPYFSNVRTFRTLHPTKRHVFLEFLVETKSYKFLKRALRAGTVRNKWLKKALHTQTTYWLLPFVVIDIVLVSLLLTLNIFQTFGQVNADQVISECISFNPLNHQKTIFITARLNILISGNLCFRVYKHQLKLINKNVSNLFSV